MTCFTKCNTGHRCNAAILNVMYSVLKNPNGTSNCPFVHYGVVTSKGCMIPSGPRHECESFELWIEANLNNETKMHGIFHGVLIIRQNTGSILVFCHRTRTHLLASTVFSNLLHFSIDIKMWLRNLQTVFKHRKGIKIVRSPRSYFVYSRRHASGFNQGRRCYTHDISNCWDPYNVSWDYTRGYQIICLHSLLYSVCQTYRTVYMVWLAQIPSILADVAALSGLDNCLDDIPSVCRCKNTKTSCTKTLTTLCNRHLKASFTNCC